MSVLYYYMLYVIICLVNISSSFTWQTRQTALYIYAYLRYSCILKRSIKPLMDRKLLNLCVPAVSSSVTGFWVQQYPAYISCICCRIRTRMGVSKVYRNAKWLKPLKSKVSSSQKGMKGEVLSERDKWVSAASCLTRTLRARQYALEIFWYRAKLHMWTSYASEFLNYCSLASHKKSSNLCPYTHMSVTSIVAQGRKSSRFMQEWDMPVLKLQWVGCESVELVELVELSIDEITWLERSMY